MKNLILLFSMLLSLTSCDSDTINPNDDNSKFQSTEITFTEIGKGGLFGNGAENISQSNLVINNQADWQNLIDQMNSVSNVSDTFSETSIDFDSYTIIAIILEVKSSGWDITINNITENENNILVSAKETIFLTTVMTQPFHIVKIPKTSKEIVFE